MQNLKNNFEYPDDSKLATLQTCIRTNDLSLLGDGTHLSLFHMLGNFTFGKPDASLHYRDACMLWDEIVRTLKIPIDNVHVHPSQDGHRILWENLGYQVVFDEECVWSDGIFKGYCCELYSNGIEIGNLVNTFGYAVDVGFGFERIHMILDNKSRVDETSLFDVTLPPILRDISRTMQVLWEAGILPGWKGRNQVCRNLLRALMRESIEEAVLSKFDWYPWVVSDREAKQNKVKMGKRVFYRHRNKGFEFFQRTYGISYDEYCEIKEFFTENGEIVRRTIDG